MPFATSETVNISYECTGRGFPIVFIHGVGIAGCAWKPQVDALRESFQCITFDNRGVGKSTGETQGLTMDVLVQDVLFLLSTLGITRAHFVGHSLGGVIVQEIALLQPEKVHSMSLLCTFSRGKEATSLSWPMLWHGIRTSIGTPRMRARAFARMVMPEAYLAEQGIDAVVEQLSVVFGRRLEAGPKVVSAQLRALSRNDSFSRLEEIRGIPTLVMSAALDPIARPEFGKRLAQALGTANFVEVAEASHALPIQLPQLTFHKLSKHLASC